MKAAFFSSWDLKATMASEAINNAMILFFIITTFNKMHGRSVDSGRAKIKKISRILFLSLLFHIGFEKFFLNITRHRLVVSEFHTEGCGTGSHRTQGS